jgi:hypothetical protein
LGAANGRLAVVRKLTVFLADMRDSIGLLFGRSRADVQEELSAYWAALNILVMRGDLDGSTPIPVGDHRGNGFAGVMSVQAVLRTVQNGWGRWDRKTEARWRRILMEASERLLYEETPLNREP